MTVNAFNPALPEQWQQLSFPLFWQGCELQVTLDAQRIAIRTSAPVSLRLNGQLITVAEESVFCLGDFYFALQWDRYQTSGG
ncbi:glycosyl hydrolase [Escherichia coli]|uniref:Glycosyl hydrolase n=1 Tax=Escherichia coli TaxID=562 RepID=A0A377D2S5_ECOLX|nr:glycosyl hydrolase [Escherichia coli]